ncbi:hypothetical protein MKW92_001004 [Papaver armeniacum]|nr:hypothetical protein MKW92_001004 [Papaver armeniacum]
MYSASENAFKGIYTSLPKPGGGEFGIYYSLHGLNDPRIVKKEDVEKIIDWERTASKQVEVLFKPAHVLLQDFTGVPAVVDLAGMPDAMNKLGSDPNKINPWYAILSNFDVLVFFNDNVANSESTLK